MDRFELEGEPVVVPAPVLAGIEAVRGTGRTNMLAWDIVVSIAAALGYIETEEWILANKRLYAEGVFRSFEAEPIDWAEVGLTEEEDHAALPSKEQLDAIEE